MGQWSHLYDRKWRKRRAKQLAEEPLCRICLALYGRSVPATVADHITPHRGDPGLFAGPLQSLCATCHSSTKQELEASGRIRGCDAEGRPLDPAHPWNTPGGVSRNISPNQASTGWEPSRLLTSGLEAPWD